MFFNKKSLLQALIALSLLAVVDLFLYLSDLENAVSVSFYLKTVTCVVYALVVKNEGFKSQEDKSLECAFHIVTATCAIWMAVIYFIAFHPTLSKFVGVILIFGLLESFNIIVELRRKLAQDRENYHHVLIVVFIFLKVKFFVLMMISVFFLLVGDWSWNIKPFYDW